MAADSPSAADRIARFAELVDAVEAAGVEVTDYDTTRLIESGDLQGTIDVRVSGVPTEADTGTPEPVESGDYDGDVATDDWVVEEDEAADEEPTPEADQSDTDDDRSAADDLDERILDTLDEEGELSGPDLKMLTESGSDVYTALNRLERNSLIAKRDDPDDGRRTLYRPAGVDVADEGEEEPDDDSDADAEVWCGVCGHGPFERLGTHATMCHDGFEVPLDHEPGEAELVEDDAETVEDVPDYEGPDPEATVADSSLSAHIVLDDVLDACVDATRADAPVVACVTDELGVHSDAVIPVLEALGLKQADRRMLVDDIGERVAAIRQEVRVDG